MARCCSHRTGLGGRLRHSPAELLLLGSAGGDLEGSEEENGPLPDVVEREERLHASDQVCAGQRELLRGRMDQTRLIFYHFLKMRKHLT